MALWRRSFLRRVVICECKVTPRRYSANGRASYDLVVVGGGSGGLACAKEAADLGQHVAVLDYVKPSTQGTKWGLGGTCVNVGCIPKKLMHQAALVGRTVKDAPAFGWNVPADVSCSWKKLAEGVQNYVRSLNWGHRVQLQDKKVEYLNAFGSFVDGNTVKAVTDKGQTKLLQARNIVLAVGGRPIIPAEIPGATEYAITSDDLFWMNKSPGKTLIVGGGYIALECGGFLTGLNFPVTIMVRSHCLRAFDQQMAQLIVENMRSEGTNFLMETKPVKIERQADGKIRVLYSDLKGNQNTGVFDSVIMATGRLAATSGLGLDTIGVNIHESTGKVIGGHNGDTERSSVPNIYAIGDSLFNSPELTPVAIKAGKLLAQRLAGKSTTPMDYFKIPTTVFTPLEYACVGISEEKAIHMYGEDNIEVFHAFYKPLEYTIPTRDASQCYIKLICDREKPGRVMSLHVLGPGAGEILQGFSVAIRCGVTYHQLMSSVGIHPTVAEEVVKLHITKRSGLDPTVTGC